MNTKKIGEYGEKCAAKYLARNGYKIVECNYKCKVSEIDIIAYDGECLCFVEVKTRSRDDYGLACEAVDYRKQRKIIQGAQSYMISNSVTSPVRFDVVEVYISRAFSLTGNKVNVIKDAFRPK